MLSLGGDGALVNINLATVIGNVGVPNFGTLKESADNTDRGGKDGAAQQPGTAMLDDKEKQKGNANRATLAVARKLVAYLIA